MQLCIEGYRSHNKELYQAIGSAALYYDSDTLQCTVASGSISLNTYRST